MGSLVLYLRQAYLNVRTCGTRSIGRSRSESPVSADLVEKLFNLKIAAKIWKIVLARALLVNIIRDKSIVQNDILGN